MGDEGKINRSIKRSERFKRIGNLAGNEDQCRKKEKNKV